ncbi:pseudouridine synthase [Salsuginibacillus kocurii]|uniref:pseudouridine synthase n=1 Tax=Salsuginibacillus kocurii TaxID=427078 RepID=UPI000475C5E1|nr:pseudouridine synthase [Salsuginibacillus kocurii]
MRIDKLLGNMGYGTRKEIKGLVKQGAVSVNGERVRQSSINIDPDEDEVSVWGEIVEYRQHIYLMMNKPGDVVSATKDENQETVIDLLEWEDAVREPFPVGRLDKDTEGLLLLMTDGKLSHALMSPKKHIEKEYEARLAEPLAEGAVQAFADGIELADGHQSEPAKLEVKEEGSEPVIKVVLTEGKYHQVKRMVAAVGNKVIELRRVRIGPLWLDEDLDPGEYRDLSEEELEQLEHALYYQE